MNRFFKNQKGFTFVELIIYVALLTIILSSVTIFSIDILKGKIKTDSRQEVVINASYALERIVSEVRSAKSINVGSSDFDVNLADPINAGKKLSLEKKDAGLDPTEFDVASNVLRIKQGAGSFKAITSDEVKVTNLVFSNLSRGNRARNVRIQITVEHVNPGDREEFEAVVSLEAAAEVHDR